jgi:hypothetical protein
MPRTLVRKSSVTSDDRSSVGFAPSSVAYAIKASRSTDVLRRTDPRELETLEELSTNAALLVRRRQVLDELHPLEQRGAGNPTGAARPPGDVRRLEEIHAHPRQVLSQLDVGVADVLAVGLHAKRLEGLDDVLDGALHGARLGRRGEELVVRPHLAQHRLDFVVVGVEGRREPRE